jgi:hypothetical protein
VVGLLHEKVDILIAETTEVAELVRSTMASLDLIGKEH